jgi:uncharacterized spore protein YtfJ
MVDDANNERKLDEIMERLSATTAESVFGEPITRGDRTIIPMAEVSAGFGFGLGSGPAGGGSGGGGGKRARPVGVVALDADGVHIHPSVDVTRLATLALLVIAWNVFWIFKTIRQRG